MLRDCRLFGIPAFIFLAGWRQTFLIGFDIWPLVRSNVLFCVLNTCISKNGATFYNLYLSSKRQVLRSQNNLKKGIKSLTIRLLHFLQNKRLI